MRAWFRTIRPSPPPLHAGLRPHPIPLPEGEGTRPPRSLAMAVLPTAELHIHTSYSFADGASQPEELVTRAKELGYQTLACTDHNGVHGAVMFAIACRD